MFGLTNAGGGGNTIAFIKVTYPEGSDCSCTNGTKTYRAKNTSGSYVFSVPDTGEWTVSCTDGSRTAVTPVSISEWDSVDAVLGYVVDFIKDGNVLSTFNITTNPTTGNPDGAITPAASGTNYATFVSDGNVAVLASLRVYLSGYSNLKIKLVTGASGNGSYTGEDVPSIGIIADGSIPTMNNQSGKIGAPGYLRKTTLSNQIGQINAGTYTVDVSSFTGWYYVYVSVSGTSAGSGLLNIEDFYLE